MEIGYERDWFIDGRPVAAAEGKKILWEAPEYGDWEENSGTRQPQLKSHLYLLLPVWSPGLDFLI
jgi:hypothetical protein